jgi:tetratricopeptide (TPR) repeat protein
MKRSALWTIMLILATLEGNGQQTVFALGRNEVSLADQYYNTGNFYSALQLYDHAARKRSSGKEVQLQIARCQYLLKEYAKAIASYDHYMGSNMELPHRDLYYYAEAQSYVSNYPKAIAYYRKCLELDPSNNEVIKKIWRLNNIQYLYEDSIHFAVRPVPVNTEAGELCPAFYGNGIAFISNRSYGQLVKKVNAAINAPYYSLYFSSVSKDSVSGNLLYGETTVLSKSFNKNFHMGPAVFYEGGRKMVFASSETETKTNSRKMLNLYFAEFLNGTWEVTSSFPYNSDKYSISDPAISKEGKTLYFSSDMKGGFGGRDLYKSEWINGKWTKPVNFGEIINTSGDEVYPFLHQSNVLYFASNGHAGMGGLDIFKATIHPDGFDEPQNVGYPLNTNHDDFGIVMDSLQTHGYFSSNRNKGGYNDDLYEFDMDLQTYPLTVNGVIKYKEHSWSDAIDLQLLPNSRVYLIDVIRKVTVGESVTDAEGNFSLVIPYFSKYMVQVVNEEGDENKASLELQKYRKETGSYEIVLIKNIF